MHIFFLSIASPAVERILSGEKRWEFRKNLRFGYVNGYELNLGDIIFLISKGGTNTIPCACAVTAILRGPQLNAYFGDYDAFHWQEAGCKEGTDRDWHFFNRNILHEYRVAVGLDCIPLPEAIALEAIQHQHTGKIWSGVGLTPLDSLKKYHIHGESLTPYFQRVYSKLFNTRPHPE